MADGRLVRMWRREAKIAAGAGGIQAQIEWLETRRVTYAEAVKGGDWEVSSTAQDGASMNSRRHISDFENHEAIMVVLESLESKLGGDFEEDTLRGTILSFRIRTGN